MSEFEELLEKIREQKPELTKEDIDDYDEILHTTTNFVDDSSNVIGCETIQKLQVYIIRYLRLLLYYYGSNLLKLNDQKTEILVLSSLYQQVISITTSTGEIVTNSAQIKILGVNLNAANDLSTQVSKMYSAAMYRYHKMRPALANMTDKKKSYVKKDIKKT